MSAHPLSSHDFNGMHIDAAAAMLGHSRATALNWLKDRGYRMNRDRSLRRSLRAQEVADEANARIQAMRPQTSCFYCGSRGECRHR